MKSEITFFNKTETVFRTIDTTYKIRNIMHSCKDDMFSVRSDEFLDSLAEKFSKYGCFLAAYKEEKLAGYIAFYCNDTVTQAAFISVIVIKKDFQRMGLGSALINEAIKKSKENGMTKLRLEVDINNENAIQFYKRMGFAVESVSTTMYMCKDI